MALTFKDIDALLDAIDPYNSGVARRDIEATIQHGLKITVKPCEARKGSKSWRVGVYVGKNKICELFAGPWGEVLDLCKSVAQVLPNADFKTD